MKKRPQRIFLVVLFVMFMTALMLADGVSSLALACNYYASPTGTGNGLSPSSPFKIANFWTVAKPGSVLCLLDGVYTGATAMINPPQNLNGTAANPIIVRAVNDGAVRINGEGVGRPVLLVNNDYFILEGFNAHSSSREAVVLSTGADNNIVRRVCAWDANTNLNVHVFSIRYGQGNLLEDVCGFGTGRKIMEYFSTPGPVTVRRAWAMWNAHALFGNSSGSPKMTYSNSYNSYGAKFENVIGTWDGAAVGAYAVLAGDGFSNRTSSTNFCTNAKYLGSIGYLKSGSTIPSLLGVAYGSRDVDCEEYRDIVFYADGFSRRPILASVFDGGFTDPNSIPCVVCDRRLTNITEIGATASSIATGTSGWTVTNRATGATVDAVPNIWNGAGSSGARVCKRYVNGTLTTTPLWPWPMDERIRAALTASGRNPDAIFGGVGNGVTQQMEAIFGPIPAGCKTGAISTPSAPSNLQATQ